MSIFHSSSVANLCYKLIPSITTFCVTLGAVGIYNNNIINNSIMTNEVGSNTSQIPGPQGPAGTQGETGPQGPVGAEGATGAIGPAGEKGDKGATGLQGVAGPAGVKGETGATGPAGPQGIAGPAGSSGSGGGSGFVVRDANGAIVEGWVYKDEYKLGVFQNGANFEVLYTGEIRATMREAESFFTTPNCTGNKVAPVGTLKPYDSYEIVVFNTSNIVIDTIGTFTVGNVKTSGSAYSLYNGVCEFYDDKGYYQITPIAKPSPVPTPWYFSPN